MLSQERLGFVGVTTAGSTIRRLFPLWAEHLGIDASIEGYDLPLTASREAYRQCVAAIRDDPRVRGALVTTHKTWILEHAADQFDVIDDHARQCREVSCISKRDGLLLGSAKDPITSRLAFERMIGADYWSGEPDAEVLCIGAGGAGLAISSMFASRPNGPARVLVTDRDPARIAEVNRVAEEMEVPIEARTVSSQADSDDLLESLAPASLVVNATGMGKDLPGAPITAAARFPERALVWELNYRGDLDFLKIAAAQAPDRDLRLFDGWVYFLYGWAAVIADVFGFDLTDEVFDGLADVADSLGHEPVVAVTG